MIRRRITKRRVARQLMLLVKTAYQALNAIPVNDYDNDEASQAIGRYDGLKQAYELLTGRSPQDVSNEVVHWYIHTDEYQASREQKS
jgi:hypothetical protein